MLKRRIIYLVLAIIFLIAIVILLLNFNHDYTEIKMNEPTWIKSNEMIKVENEQIFITIKGDIPSKKDLESKYTITVPFVLEANGREFKGDYIFDSTVKYPSYSADENIPYKVDIIDFEDQKVKIIISEFD